MGIRVTTLIAHWILICFVSNSWAGGRVRELLKENRPEEAAAECRQYEVLTGTDNDISFACAWAYYRTDRNDSAEKIMQKLRKQSEIPEYQLLLAYQKMKIKKWDQAREITEKVSKDNRGTPIGLTAEELAGEIYEMKGQIDPAAFIYKGVVRDDPTRARAHWGLGRYYLARGDTGRAKIHLEQAAKFWPKHVGSRYNLAVMTLSQDNVSEASRWLAEAYKLDKADAGVLEQLGVLFEKRGMISEAIRHWQRALDIKKGSSLAKEKLATYNTHVIDALVATGENRQALDKMEVAGRSVASDPKLLLRRALIYKNLGKYEKAMADLIVYTNQKPKDSAALRDLGICYVNMKQIEKAHEQFLRALAEEPNNGMNFAWVAYTLEAKGEFEKAREAWTKSLEFMKEPAEVEKASRKIAALEKKIGKREKEREKREREKRQQEEEQ